MMQFGAFELVYHPSRRSIGPWELSHFPELQEQLGGAIPEALSLMPACQGSCPPTEIQPSPRARFAARLRFIQSLTLPQKGPEKAQLSEPSLVFIWGWGWVVGSGGVVLGSLTVLRGVPCLYVYSAPGLEFRVRCRPQQKLDPGSLRKCFCIECPKRNYIRALGFL